MSFFYSGRVKFPDSVKPLMVPIDSVRQHERNPNNGEVEMIAESIRINGFTTVITVDAKTKQILAGNHRWQALHSLGATECPVLFIDYDNADQARRILVADNETGRLAHADESMLMEHLKALQETELGLEGSGVTQERFEELALLLTAEDSPDLDHGGGIALHGIFEATVSFETEWERDNFESEMKGRFGDEAVRTVNL